MFKNFIKIAIRSLRKNKTVSFINIAGLALGMTGAALLILNINYDLSVDQFHTGKENIYKAYNKGVVDGVLQCWSVTPAPLGPALKKDYPEVVSSVRVSETSQLLSYGTRKVSTSGNFVDPAFLRMFSFPLLKGNAGSSLGDVHSIVITEQLAKKLFGNEDPMNKTILADNADNFTVTGVIKDLPDNTQFKFEYLLPWEFMNSKGIQNADWTNSNTNTFVQLKPSINVDALNTKVGDIEGRYGDNKQEVKIFLYPLTRTYLYNRFENGKAAGGRIKNVRMLGILAGIILLIACINFMNLSTARSEKRAKEVGVRKVIGAGRASLIVQFIGESILLASIGGVIALLLTQMALPAFSVLIKGDLRIPYQSPFFWLAGLCFITLTGIFAGSYPAFYLSSFKPVRVLKGAISNGPSLVTPRKMLVILQFVFSIFLINFTIIFQKQVKFEQGRDIGFVKEDLIFHPLTDDLRKSYPLIRDELLSSGTAVAVSKSSKPVTRGEGTAIGGLVWDGMDAKANINFQLLDTRGGFVKTNGLQLLAGRDIDVETMSTDTSSCMINETALKVIGFKDPIGKNIKDDSINWKIVGVVRDFVIGSPTQAIKPMLIRGTGDADFISIRLNGARSSLQSVKNAESILKKYNPNFLTAVQFADEDYASKFKQAEDASVLINRLAMVAIFISCMGLFGLATHMAETRTREIGIRKVLGASVKGITFLLAKYFIKLVVIAVVIASPLAWFFMNFYLQQFDYRTDLSWWILIISGGTALLVALFTISYQTIRAALVNPAKSIRTE